MDGLDPNAFFVAFSGNKISEMAQAVVDSGYLSGGCTIDELKDIFQERNLGRANVLNILRYAASQDVPSESNQP